MILENDNHIFWIEEASSIQSLIFSKEKFDKSKAQSWAKKHGFKTGVDEKENTYRLRQQEPGKFKSMRTKQLGAGIKAVIGIK